MSLYAVQDNVGNYWDFDNRGFHSPQNNARRNTTFNLALADAIVQMNGGHVAELFEAPAKVVVSEEEAEMLEQAKDDYCAASVISSYSTEHIGAMGQDRLMRAYVNGWTVEKPKRWNVKVPKKGSGDDKHYWAKENDGALTWAYLISKDYMIPAQQFTAAEIEHYGLQDCERVEVCADNARTTGEVTDDEQ